jgi:AraC-like DNA-binding protein
LKTVPASHGLHLLRIFLDFARRGGMSETECLAGSGIDPRLLDDPAAEVDARQEFAVLRRLLGRFGAHLPGGLMVGARLHLTSSGMLGFAQTSCPDLRSAIDLGLRYLELTPAFSRIVTEQGDGEWRMVFDDSGLPEDLRRPIVEAEALAILNMAGELLGARLPLRRIHFSFADPGYDAAYLQFFGQLPRFGQPRNFVALDASCLDLPLPQANAITAQVCENHCEEQVRSRRLREGIAGKVRRLLRADPSRATELEVAAALRITPRTLQRQLAAEHTGFRMLQEEVRAALAVELLKKRRLTVEMVADRLGYSEPSAFVRAFKRWQGTSPAAYREALQA